MTGGSDMTPGGTRPVDLVRRRIAVMDAVVLLLAMAACLLWEGGQGRATPVLAVSLLGFAVLWWAVLSWRGTRAADILGAGVEEYRRLADASGLALVLAAAGAYFVGLTDHRLGLLAAAVVGLLGLTVYRWANRVRLGIDSRSGRVLRRVLVVADDDRVEDLTRQVSRHGSAGYLIVASLPASAGDSPTDTVVKIAMDCRADTIVVDADLDRSWIHELGWDLEDTDISLMLAPALVDVAGPRLSIHPVEGLALIRVDQPRLRLASRAVKRTMDIVGASLGLLVLGLPILVIAALIRRDSPGPAFFVQPRVGRDGRLFGCVKFRTMVDGADAMREQLREGSDDVTFKMEADPRITRLGRTLRRYSIDEIPQLVNVFRGEMSLVGPRPHPLDDVARYDRRAHRRLVVKPGMTGLWQVSGRSDLDWDESLLIDLRYIENWSVALDLALLAKTVSVVAHGRGAY